MSGAFLFAADVPSAVTEDEARELARLAAGRKVLEIGSHRGRSTIALAGAARIVHAVDWHRGDIQAGMGDTLQEFLGHLTRYGVRDQVVVHLGRFEDVLPVLLREAFDMVFLDGLHDRASVDRDVQLLRPLVVKKGILAFHDYGIAGFGVTGAVDALAKAEGAVKKGVRSLAVLYL